MAAVDSTNSSSRAPSQSSSIVSSASQNRSRGRTPRYAAASRLPVLLEFTSATTCRAGYAGDAQPRRQVILPSPQSSSSVLVDTNFHHADTARLMRDAFQRLGQDPAERNVIVLVPPVAGLTFIQPNAVLRRVLWDMGVPALTIMPSILHAATAMPVETGILVHMEAAETHCVVYACDTVLPFTYQVVPTTTNTAEVGVDPSDIDATVEALLQCLQACPLQVRKQAVSNLFFSGQVCNQQPTIGRRVARRLRDVLLRQESATSNEQLNPASAVSTTHGAVLTSTPVALKNLQCLAGSVGVIQTPCCPDLITWVGTSLWAAHWHGQASLEDNKGGYNAVLEWTRRPG